MADEFQLKDSGERQEFQTGAVRDTARGKSRPDLISPHANMREGMIMAKGAEKYAERNWEQGIPISRCIASTERHLNQYKLGQTDEDHLAMARTNLSFILHFEGEIKAGRMDPAIDDMPKYGQKEQRPVYALSWPGQRVIGQVGPIKRQSVAPTFYIAGPMRSYPDLNFPEFDRVAKLAREKGYNIISPAELDREHGIDPVNDPDSVERANKADPQLVQTVVMRDTEVIMALHPDNGDGIILLSGWEKSIGARAEVALALWLGIEQFFECNTTAKQLHVGAPEWYQLFPHEVERMLFNQSWKNADD